MERFKVANASIIFVLLQIFNGFTLCRALVPASAAPGNNDSKKFITSDTLQVQPEKCPSETVAIKQLWAGGASCGRIYLYFNMTLGKCADMKHAYKATFTVYTLLKNITEGEEQLLSSFCKNDTCYRYFSKDLRPNETYIASVQLWTMVKPLGSEVVTGIIHTFDTVPSSPTNLQVQSLAPHTLHVSWTKPATYPECVHTYYVSYHGGNINKTIPVSQTSLNLTELTPCQWYEIEVWAQTPDGLSGSSSKLNTNNVTTAASDFNPRGLRISPGQREATVYADLPVCTENFDRMYYSCHQKNEFESEVETYDPLEDNGYVTFSGLEPCTNYGFEVLSVYKDSHNGSATSETMTLEEAPSPPQNFEASLVTSSSITVTWDAPKTAWTCVTAYKVTMFTGGELYNSGHVDKGQERKRTFDNLTPCITYRISVAAVTPSGSLGQESTLDITTREVVPGSPVIPHEKEIGPNSVTLRWLETDSNPQCVDHYLVVIYNTIGRTYRVPPDQLTCKVDGLMACAGYKFTIASVTRNNQSRTSKPHGFYTKKLAPPKIPSGIKVVNSTDYGLDATWIQPDVINQGSLCGDPSLEINCMSLKGGNFTVNCTADMPPGQRSDCWIEADLVQSEVRYDCQAFAVNKGGTSPPVKFYIHPDSGGSAVSGFKPPVLLVLLFVPAVIYYRRTL